MAAPVPEVKFDDVLRPVAQTIKDLHWWLVRNVRGSRGFDPDDRRSYTNEVAWRLYTGQCRCGGANCRRPIQHGVAHLGASGLTLEQFVKRAVHGPKGLIAGSIGQGMMWPNLLTLGLRVRPVELRVCPECGYHNLDDSSCDQCGAGLQDLSETKIIARNWVVVERLWTAVRRWGCRPSKSNDCHYYPQDGCMEEITHRNGKMHYHVTHGAKHDCCPLSDCPSTGQRHHQRGATLWVPAGRVRPAIGGALPGVGPELLLDALVTGLASARCEATGGAMKQIEEFVRQCDAHMGKAAAALTQRGKKRRELGDQALELVRKHVSHALAEEGIDPQTCEFWRGFPSPGQIEQHREGEGQ